MSRIPKFYLVKRKDSDGNIIVKDCQIKMVLNIPSGRVEYYPRLKIDAKYFNEDYLIKNKKPIKNNAPYSDEYNDRLSFIYADAIAISNEISISRKEISVKEFKERLDKFHNPKRSKEISTSNSFVDFAESVLERRKSKKLLKDSGKPFTPATIHAMSVALSFVKRYSKAKNKAILIWDEIDTDLFNEMRKFALTDGISLNTYFGYMRDFKNFCNCAISEGIVEERNMSVLKQLKISVAPLEHVALKLEHLNKLESAVFEVGSMKDRVRDLFLIACYSAVRFSDLSQIVFDAVEDDYIRIIQKKTGKRVTIPVTKRLKRIMDKYNNVPPKPPTIAYYLKVLRIVAEEAGLTEMGRVTVMDGAETKTIEKPLHELIGSHTARRTYATMMFLAGAPTMLIMAVTGHSTEKAFLRYIRATNEDTARMMREYIDKAGF